MSELLDMSARFIDSGVADGPVNRLTLELAPIADRIAMVEAFSHVIALDTDDGMVLFDTSLEAFGLRALVQLRRWTDSEVDTIVYTHGHVDHVGGARPIISDARDKKHRKPTVVGHTNVGARFDRYDLTNGYNGVINARQFRGMGLVSSTGDRPLFPKNLVRPNVTFASDAQVRVGDTTIELHHGLGETDDHCWAWLPDHEAVVVGDFLTWVFPNAGNPQKVQRYPMEWAQVLRTIAARRPQLLLPAHGLPIAGEARIQQVLHDVAGVLEHLVGETLEMMNDGATLDQILTTVRVPAEALEKPYLQPTYDEPEFVIRNVWRLYGGWYDGNPSRLKPPSDAAAALELVRLAGGIDPVVRRALDLRSEGELRLAAHLIEQAVLVAPEDVRVHKARARIYKERRWEELSMMSQGIFGWAAKQSERIVEQLEAAGVDPLDAATRADRSLADVEADLDGSVP